MPELSANEQYISLLQLS